MKKVLSFYNELNNSFKYRSHSAEVVRFVEQTYPTLTAKSIAGPLFDNELNIDREDRKDLFYLVTFKKDCPENQIHLKIKKSTKEVSEIEKYY